MLLPCILLIIFQISVDLVPSFRFSTYYFQHSCFTRLNVLVDITLLLFYCVLSLIAFSFLYFLYSLSLSFQDSLHSWVHQIFGKYLRVLSFGTCRSFNSLNILYSSSIPSEESLQFIVSSLFQASSFLKSSQCAFFQFLISGSSFISVTIVVIVGK